MEVELITHSGDDLLVVNSARVSMDKKHESIEDGDSGLINYLATHNHWTPFSHPQITIREKVPIFVARQRFKHTVGFSYNETSRRYVDSPPELYYPEEWRKRPTGSIKQGSGGVHKGTDELSNRYKASMFALRVLYQEMIDNGVAPEQARMVLPQSMYTEYYVTGSLAAWARAYSLRIDSHAQQEIQEVAKMWNETLSPLFPLSWKALTEGDK